MEKKKGYISEQMSAGRIVAHGKITTLSEGFALPSGLPFALYVRPIDGSESPADVLISVRCYQDHEAAQAPFACGDWSPYEIIEIAPDNSLLDSYELYWGSGYFIPENN